MSIPREQIKTALKGIEAIRAAKNTVECFENMKAIEENLKDLFNYIKDNYEERTRR